MIKSGLLKHLLAAAVAGSMMVAGVGAFGDVAEAGKKRKSQKVSQGQKAKNKAKFSQNQTNRGGDAKANGGRGGISGSVQCINAGPGAVFAPVSTAPAPGLSSAVGVALNGGVLLGAVAVGLPGPSRAGACNSGDASGGAGGTAHGGAASNNTQTGTQTPVAANSGTAGAQG